MPVDDEKSLLDPLGSDAFPGSKIVPCDSSKAGFRALVRRRSSLFNTLPSSRSRSEKTSTICDHEQSQSTIVLESKSKMLSNTASAQLPSQDRPEKRQKSLFGAVMKRSECLEPTADAINRSPNAIAINKGDIEESNLFDEIGNSVMSPTGKTIMGFVNNFGDSPFRFQSPKKRALVHSASKAPSHVDQKQGFISKRHENGHKDLHSKIDQDWFEIPIVRDQLACFDFSLRTSVLVECNVKFCLRSVMVQDNVQKHLAYWIFPQLPPDSLSTSLSLSLDHTGDSSSTRGASKTDFSRSVKQEMCSELGKRLTDLVKGDKALYSTKRLGKSQRKVTTTISMYPLRWQEATRSIFLNWCSSIKALVDGEETRMIASDIYFYCVAKDHVTMFRVDEIIDGNSDMKYEPRVIVSNISTEFQKKLEHEGVEEIQFLNEPTSEAAEGSSPRENYSFAPMSPNVKAELEALRRAQVLGENAGADVRVKSDAKRAKKSPASRAATPCCICGFDNVSCFFEAYLNSFGQMHTIQSQQPVLPVLVSDTMGPFLHATLETLKSRPIKTMGAQSLRLEGLIMPRAFRNVVATITREVTKMGTATAPQLQRNLFEDKEGICYMLIETAINELNPLSKKLEDSRAFNGWNENEDSQSVSSKTLECEMGRCIKRLVWEAKNPEVLVCNFE
mmetsp:Transcript_44257/g.106622  ORF Transcript_44257/g.106622 Transcript_44257/m.106622 type:complete len:675 (+) Transcript_44257:121-2145(+)